MAHLEFPHNPQVGDRFGRWEFGAGGHWIIRGSGGGSLADEAPLDGRTYGRRDGDWELASIYQDLTPNNPGIGTFWARPNGQLFVWTGVEWLPLGVGISKSWDTGANWDDPLGPTWP